MGIFQTSGKFPKYYLYIRRILSLILITIDLYLSILRVVSKIIEKVIFKQLYEYLTHNNLLTVSQHGFRPIHFTLAALLEATNNWYLNIDDGLINSVLFLDLKKAFNTVDHSILLKKLQLYGLHPHAVHWFKSYLCNRFQSTYVNTLYQTILL